MGLFRTLIIILLIYVVFRYILRRLFVLFIRPSLKERESPRELKRDEIVPCPTCGTYNPKGLALLANGEYFCNEKCLKGRRP